MGEKLNTLVDNYVKSKEEKLFQNNIDEKQKTYFIESTKKQLIQEIYDEVETEVKETALKKAQKEIEEKARLQRIAEFRKLMLDGFIVAIFVGLFVNQVTEFIGHLKGTDVLNSIGSTIILSIIFILICIGIFAWRFVAELIKLLDAREHNETD